MTKFHDDNAQGVNNGSIHLSPRESEVLPLLLRGYGSKEIARKLKISPRTVDIYRSAILGKMRVRKTAQLFFALQKINPPFSELFQDMHTI